MTTDAKIGLLLGLVFIFLIAFLINGLPNFGSGNKDEGLTERMMNNELGIASQQKKAQRVIIKSEPRIQTTIHSEPRFSETLEPRYESPLPQSIAEETNHITVALAQIKSQVPENPSDQLQQESNSKKELSNQRALNKFYIVCEGDSLAYIAKKFYGDQEGNKRNNIERIFQANQNILKSASQIHPGQKLVIPPLGFQDNINKDSASSISSKIFEKVESIGKQHVSKSNKDKVKEYIVKEGDSLWKIAAKNLKNGDRYTEIAKLNKDILDYEDYLKVGMKIKIPAQ